MKLVHMPQQDRKLMHLNFCNYTFLEGLTQVPNAPFRCAEEPPVNTTKPSLLLTAEEFRFQVGILALPNIDLVP